MTWQPAIWPVSVIVCTQIHIYMGIGRESGRSFRKEFPHRMLCVLEGRTYSQNTAYPGEISAEEMLQIRLSKGSGSEGGPSKVPASDNVTVSCPEHLVLAELPVAKGLGISSAVKVVKTVGRKSRRKDGDKIHICLGCDLPIAIYGRLSPCGHAFCLTCARSEPSCYLCDERIQKIQTIKMLEGLFICGAPHCLRSFVKRFDFELHVKETHSDLLHTATEKTEVHQKDVASAKPIVPETPAKQPLPDEAQVLCRSVSAPSLQPSQQHRLTSDSATLRTQPKSVPVSPATSPPEEKHSQKSQLRGSSFSTKQQQDQLHSKQQTQQRQAGYQQQSQQQHDHPGNTGSSPQQQHQHLSNRGASPQQQQQHERPGHTGASPQQLQQHEHHGTAGSRPQQQQRECQGNTGASPQQQRENTGNSGASPQQQYLMNQQGSEKQIYQPPKENYHGQFHGEIHVTNPEKHQNPQAGVQDCWQQEKSTAEGFQQDSSTYQPPKVNQPPRQLAPVLANQAGIPPSFQSPPFLYSFPMQPVGQPHLQSNPHFDSTGFGPSVDKTIVQAGMQSIQDNNQRMPVQSQVLPDIQENHLRPPLVGTLGLPHQAMPVVSAPLEGYIHPDQTVPFPHFQGDYDQAPTGMPAQLSQHRIGIGMDQSLHHQDVHLGPQMPPLPKRAKYDNMGAHVEPPTDMQNYGWTGVRPNFGAGHGYGSWPGPS